MLSLSPSTPPTNHAKRPPLSNRGKHKVVLCASTSEAMSRKAPDRSLSNSCPKGKFVNVFLHGVMSDRLAWLQDSIGSHSGEDIVVRFKRTMINLLF